MKYFSNMSISMILAAILKICKLGNKSVISQHANIGFRIQHTKLPMIKLSNPILHKMPVLVNFSDLPLPFIMLFYIRYICADGLVL